MSTYIHSHTHTVPTHEEFQESSGDVGVSSGKAAKQPGRALGEPKSLQPAGLVAGCSDGPKNSQKTWQNQTTGKCWHLTIFQTWLDDRSVNFCPLKISVETVLPFQFDCFNLTAAASPEKQAHHKTVQERETHPVPKGLSMTILTPPPKPILRAVNKNQGNSNKNQGSPTSQLNVWRYCHLKTTLCLARKALKLTTAHQLANSGHPTNIFVKGAAVVRSPMQAVFATEGFATASSGCWLQRVWHLHATARVSPSFTREWPRQSHPQFWDLNMIKSWLDMIQISMFYIVLHCFTLFYHCFKYHCLTISLLASVNHRGMSPLRTWSVWLGKMLWEQIGQIAGGFVYACILTWVWVKIRYPNNWIVNTKLD